MAVHTEEEQADLKEQYWYSDDEQTFQIGDVLAPTVSKASLLTENEVEVED